MQRTKARPNGIFMFASSVQFSAAAEGTLQVDGKYLWTSLIETQKMLSTTLPLSKAVKALVSLSILGL